MTIKTKELLIKKKNTTTLAMTRTKNLIWTPIVTV